MKVITRMELNESFSGVSIALGTFDGVHLGHQKVIGRAVEFANRSGGESAVFTFENHPLSILAPHQCPPLITSLAEKERLLADMRVDILCRIPFTNDLLHLTPEEFVNKLVSLFSPSYVVIGPNYSFGYRSSGTPELLTQIGKEKGFVVEVQEAVYIDGNMVSSTSIRQCVSSGNMEQAAKLMGRPFCLFGKVIHGDMRGRVLGFPTANIQPSAEQLLPADGVYTAHAIIGTQRLPALVNVGTNPTFNNQNRRVEVYVLDFQADLYDQELGVEFLKRLRGEQIFSSIQELKDRIALDVIEGKQYFKSHVK
ncbi:bifunctional riboflavin kinase/FMN adenylyltransferase [Anaerosporomusa subterranea]|uniref:Riboflavin biosynthesis protein n=1 Tax=Anaerosporomusa subterranea TaxID=1794912 RepID=A0A154BTL6_ANASB|nr:bifunctional riboflavin kinase/FAD synthetase [Anaerosporomusa subterranea]KYZ77247.1 bifunctional riboflavin kinase/FMN adenylyltransferase [Anaerosporomusa subterranea]